MAVRLIRHKCSRAPHAYESHKLQEFQKLHEQDISNVFLLLVAFGKFIDFITKTVHSGLTEKTTKILDSVVLFKSILWEFIRAELISYLYD